MILHLNPFTGLAGDMLLGALLDAGASLDAVRRAVTLTGLTGWRVDAEEVRTGPLVAVRVRVGVEDDATERSASELLAMAARTGLPVAEAALTAIAEAEGALHGVPAADVHLHELGGHDTLIDIVGCAAALRDLGVTHVHSAPVPLGSGAVRTRHGVLPVPAPATLALLEGAIVRGGAVGEAVTPTGAALLRAAGATYGAAPEMTLRATGYGAGTRELPDRPNVVVAMLGEPVAEAGRQVVLSTNLDDVTGEVLGHVIARALDAGAADAWVTPAVMKKGRPAHVLHVLTSLELAGRLQELVLAETGSLGLRRSVVEKVALPRHFETVRLYGQDVRMKHGRWGVKPEHDDLVRLAAATGRPLRQLALEALEAL
ncbi:nickel pincer cofactor biosynthesis protein LarC [Sphaerisporangium sp. TRM90804]|uniref:nickel pincer cofactor biosynthesis protein LarC n=1 Tax=Sphaerisporangium sp. TRM90804 TaxID=3031113 RepID=UPI00244BA46C|nr:nickel pincer cofactor biosynthesis protein LarC [Sphaerisporangium sp. TRM90804]MDH2430779.1 nickel pincer cofactor biosynthesis protein LarC [Sphaerisporangium sp. TRM90804]